MLKARGRTQSELAAHLGLSRNHVSQMLSGKRRMSVETMHAIEAFLAAAENKIALRGVAETGAPPFAVNGPRTPRSLTLEQALALKGNPPPKLPLEEQERLVRELKELSEAYKLLPRRTTLSDDELLGYDQDGLPR